MSDNKNRERDNIRRLVSEAIQSQIGGAGTVPQTGVDTNLFDESARDVIAEADLVNLPDGSRLLVREDAIITPAALDLIKSRQIEIRHRLRRSAAGKNKLVAIGSDHGGFEMKESLKDFLEDLGYSYRDFGTSSVEAVDYPDFAHAVAKAVADGVCELGIIVDGAGIGSCMTANKVPGVRAAMCYDEATAKNSREHNYANVLSLGGRMISGDMMRRIVKTWLATPEGEDRHGRRVAKIMAVEKQYLR